MSELLRLEKVVVNIGVGEAGERLEKAKELLERLTGQKPVETIATKRIPTWGIRKGLPIGCKVTLRKDRAVEFLKKAFAAVDNKISAESFDEHGNVSFGIKEYIDIPGMKYDPNIGMFGMDVTVCITKIGKRVRLRKIKRQKANTHPTKEESMEFIKNMFGVEIE